MMDAAVELAGFFAAHSVWCIVDGETLIPLLAFQNLDGTQGVRRCQADTLEAGVAQGKQWMLENPEGVSLAVLIYDAFVTLPTGKVDSLILEIRAFGAQTERLRMAVPYRHAFSGQAFAVYKPKFLEAEHLDHDFGALGEAFFRGVDQHQKGSAIWNAHLDETL